MPASTPGVPFAPLNTWRRLAGCVVLLGLLGAAPAQAQPGVSDAQKAEVIYRVLMFVTWPAALEAPGQPLQVCTVDEGPMAAALRVLAGRTMRQLTIDVRRTAGPEQLTGCHLLYLPAPQPAWRAALSGVPVLVVSDAPAMLDHGAIINLQAEDGRVVFDVDLDAARRAGLAISAKLLRLARFVRHQAALP